MNLFTKQPLPTEEAPIKDAAGRALLTMRVRDDTDFLSPFSQSNTPVIASDVADFLNSRIETVSPDSGIHLEIHSDCITEEEALLYHKGIKAYYTEQYHKTRRELRRNNRLALLLLILGVITLSVMIFVEALFENVIWTEVIDIAAWVFLWEAVYLYFLENRSLRIRCRQSLSLTQAEITFLPLDK
ncbi:MAG: hypothetical protein IJW46_06195 [Clostridia bacterium]|nr:hypothetical protein [Clostridia bacterium]